MNAKKFLIKSHSQAMQDIFALVINECRTNGYFVDLGCNEPDICNNSFLLEKIGWKGFLVDYDINLVNKCNSIRKNPAFFANLIEESITKILNENNSPEIIEYVSIDLDNGAALDCIKQWDFSKYKIKALTFEHDSYLGGEAMKQESRDLLIKNGMELVCSDVTIFNGKSFEDWYVNPSLVNENIYSHIRCSGLEYSAIFNRL